VILLLALTELRLLAGHFGIDSIIKKDPDVVLTVRDAKLAQMALMGAPGTLRVIDEKTIYLRMPATFMESDVLLLALCNLMRAAHQKEADGQAPPVQSPLARPAAVGQHR
jgi:hypothetical protein